VITIDVLGAEELTRRLAAVPDKLQRRVIREMSQIVYDSAQRAADAHTKTGALARSLVNKPVPNGRYVGHDLQAAPHAVFVHWGTRPHEIRPRRRKRLRWVSGDEFVFARKVQHPGYKGDAYLVRAADEAVRAFDAIVRKAQLEV
jgi:hypothetical protein